MTQPYLFVRDHRSPRTVAILICVYGALFALVILFDAAWWLVALFALVPLPAVWDVYAGKRAGLELDQDGLRWFSGKRLGNVENGEIDHLRFDTRWDFSVRVTVVLNSGKRVRLPDEACPPHREFERALTDRGMQVSRHHFTVF